MSSSTSQEPSQRVLVFGASGGIGSALCELLHRRGARLAVAGRDEEKLRALSQSHEAVPLPGDVRDADTVAATFQGAQEALGGLDAVVQLVGSVLLKPAHLIDDASFEDCLQTNLWSAFRVLRESAKAMRKGGSVCLMSTVAVQTGLPNHEAISAAKGGVEGLVRAAAASYAPRKLRVNAVAPGLVETPMTSF
jgi:3-oxoacyl-[acyl-carrier protein] reductase